MTLAGILQTGYVAWIVILIIIGWLAVVVITFLWWHIIKAVYRKIQRRR